MRLPVGVVFTALALIGCQDLGVSYHVGVSSGVSSFDRPVSDFNSQAVYVGVSLSPYMARHNRRSEELALAHLSNERGTLSPEAFAAVLQGTADDAPEDEHLTDFLPPIPETTAEAWPLLIYAGFIAILAAAIGGLWWIGFPLPMISPRKKAAQPKPEDTD